MKNILDFLGSSEFWLTFAPVFVIVFGFFGRRYLRRKEVKKIKEEYLKVNPELIGKHELKNKDEKSPTTMLDEMIIERNEVHEETPKYTTAPVTITEEIEEAIKPDPERELNEEPISFESYDRSIKEPRNKVKMDGGSGGTDGSSEYEGNDESPEMQEEFSEEPVTIKPTDRVKMTGSKAKMSSYDIVDFAGFSPSSMQAGNSYIIDIWAFTASQFESVKEIVKELDRDKITGYKSGLQIDRGTVISIHLVSMSKALTIENSTEAIAWNGEKTNASFAISFDNNARIGKHIAKASISVSGIPIATLLLDLSVSELESEDYQKCEGGLERINSAFASYSSNDRAEVLGRLQGIKTIHPDLDIFFDVFSLRSGNDWESKLNEHVPSKDKFLLFWSKAASESEWVEKEWKMALEKRGISYIDPVPLDDPKDAPPPNELSSLHFNDLYMLNIKYLELRDKTGS